MSRVDVVVPCYRYAHFLRECVGSVLAQDGVDVRVLILDDASPDDTPAVAAELMARDRRVEYRRHAQNRGHIATYNEGLEWASGDYTLLLSADDLLTPGALGRAARLMDAHPEVGLVYGRVLRFRTGAALPEPAAVPAEDDPAACAARVRRGSDWLAEVLSDPSESITSPEAVVRTSVQREIGGYRPDLPHTGDQEMWMRFAVHADVGVLDADQAYYRQHPESMHRRRFDDALVSLEQRRRADDVFFATCGDRLAPGQRRQFRRRAARGLARMALWDAYVAFYESDLKASRALARFAAGVHPPARYWPLYARITCMRGIGPKGWAALRRLAGRASGRRAAT